jgi:hypothetical protein
MIAPALQHLCAAGFAQEVKEHRDHFDLMGIGVNDGMAQLGPQLVDLGIGLEHCRHDFLLLAEALAAPDFPARYSQLGTSVTTESSNNSGTRNQMTSSDSISSSSALACFRSVVSKPSVNQP